MAEQQVEPSKEVEQPPVAPAVGQPGAPVAVAAQPPASASTPAPATPSWPTPRVFLPPTTSGPSSSSGSASASASSSTTPRVAPAASSSTPSSSSRIIPPLPNEDPKPTAEEIKAAYASTLERNQRAGIGPDAPLMTRAMREKHEAKFDRGKVKRTFSEVRVRFRLPDRTQLEYTLPSSTKLLDLYPLLRSTALPDPTSTTTTAALPRFILYTTPPRLDLSESDRRLTGKAIGKMGWGGAAVVSLRWIEDDSDAARAGEAKRLNRADARQPLREGLRERGEVVEPPRMGMTGDGQEMEGKGKPAAAASGGRTLGGGSGQGGEEKEKKVPKWFKGFKK